MRISRGPISENVHNILMYICAKFGACITKCTTGLLYCFTINTLMLVVFVQLLKYELQIMKTRNKRMNELLELWEELDAADE